MQTSRFGFFKGRGKTVRNLLIVLVVAAVLVWIIRPSSQQPPPGGRFGNAISVGDAKAEKGDARIVLNALGTVTPLATVTVKTQINGQLQQIAFSEGQLVKKGDFLAQIDPRPYQAALEQAQGTMTRDQALLKNAQVDLERYRKLVAEDSIASQQRDTQEALVRQYQGTVLTDQAAVDNAKLNLDYCHIVSPVTGRVGLRQVDQGNYVTPGDTNGIVVITQLQPMSVIFTLPENDVLKVTKQVHSGVTLQATAMGKDNVEKLADGTLSTIDNQIDTTTGTFKLRALFDNQDESLFPNQFVNIQLLVDTLHDQTIVPTSSVQRGAPGTFVYLINADSTVSVKPVTLGVADGERQVVTAGLQPGDTVVTDGVDRLRDGAKVILPNATPAADGAAPAQRRGRRGGNAPGGNGPGANGTGSNGQQGANGPGAQQPGGRPPAQ